MPIVDVPPGPINKDEMRAMLARAGRKASERHIQRFDAAVASHLSCGVTPSGDLESLRAKVVDGELTYPEAIWYAFEAQFDMPFRQWCEYYYDAWRAARLGYPPPDPDAYRKA